MIDVALNNTLLCTIRSVKWLLKKKKKDKELFVLRTRSVSRRVLEFSATSYDEERASSTWVSKPSALELLRDTTVQASTLPSIRGRKKRLVTPGKLERSRSSRTRQETNGFVVIALVFSYLHSRRLGHPRELHSPPRESIARKTAFADKFHRCSLQSPCFFSFQVDSMGETGATSWLRKGRVSEGI